MIGFWHILVMMFVVSVGHLWEEQVKAEANMSLYQKGIEQRKKFKVFGRRMDMYYTALFTCITCIIYWIYFP